MQFERIHQPDAELEHLITPYFRFETLENVPQSEIKGEAVMETNEVVELRFAGDKNYAPVLPALSMYRMDGHHGVTYAERFAKQYAEFQQGAAQHASGTPPSAQRVKGGGGTNGVRGGHSMSLGRL